MIAIKPQRFELSTEPSAGNSTCETTRPLLNSSNAKNFARKCFFCNQTAEDYVLHQCQTLHMDFCVRKIAHEQGGARLLAKLREGDMVAVEASVIRVDSH